MCGIFFEVVHEGLYSSVIPTVTVYVNDDRFGPRGHQFYIFVLGIVALAIA